MNFDDEFEDEDFGERFGIENNFTCECGLSHCKKCNKPDSKLTVEQIKATILIEKADEFIWNMRTYRFENSFDKNGNPFFISNDDDEIEVLFEIRNVIDCNYDYLECVNENNEDYKIEIIWNTDENIDILKNLDFDE
ncbi:MAG: hypothetical protein LHW41_09270 [Candidatus Cloacimonetes bacterium]|nr:hypothetical protein [Candidatus Cloacimonadota bacterium]